MCDSQLEKVISCDSLEKVSSVGSLPESFDIVPELMVFKFKMRASPDVAFSYDLKSGKALPYSVKLKGFDFEFSNFLIPNVMGFTGYLDKQEGYWVFNVSEESCDSPVPKRLKSLPSLSIASQDDAMNLTDGSISVSEGLDDSAEDEELERRLRNLRGSPSNLSGSMSPSLPILSVTSSPPPAVASVPGKKLSAGKKTVHQQPNWLQELKKSFRLKIIEICSAKTRHAVDNNEYIENGQDHLKAHSEIINVIIDYIKNIFGGAGNPARKDMREIVIQLAFEYPEMFRSREEEVGGKRKVEKEEDQARKMTDRYREKMRRESSKAANSCGIDVGEAVKKPVKKCYGVVTEKLNNNKKLKPETLSLLASTVNMDDFAQREAIFEKHRPELTAEFKSSGKYLDNVCRGVLLHDAHLGSQFQYMTDTPPLNENIEKNLRTQLDHIETYLRHVNQTVEFQTMMEKVDQRMHVMFDGSSEYKDISLLCLACEHFDKQEGSKFIRMLLGDAFPEESDPPNKSSSPHLVAVLIRKHFIYELWAEGKKLIGNMDFVSALAAFFHLCFIFDLKYIQEGQTVADLIQRMVCKYGDKSGTRTWRRKDTAEKKLDSYYSKLYKITN